MGKPKRMTWEEIAAAYPDQWVGLTDIEWDGIDVRTAVVKYTDKSGDELISMQIKDKGRSLRSFYTTPDNVPFIGVLQ